MAVAGGSFADWLNTPLPDLRAAAASLPQVEAQQRAGVYQDLLMARPGMRNSDVRRHMRELQRAGNPRRDRPLTVDEIKAKFLGAGMAPMPKRVSENPPENA